MKRLLPFIFLALLAVSCTSQRLGHGYKLVPRTVDMHGVSGAFEGLAHYQDLYYGSRCLGTVGQWSISPSGGVSETKQIGPSSAKEFPGRDIRLLAV